MDTDLNLTTYYCVFCSILSALNDILGNDTNVHTFFPQNNFTDLKSPNMKAAIDKVLSLAEGDGIKELQHHLTSLSHDQVCV